MIKTLVKRFVKSDNLQSIEGRTQSGVLSGITGIIGNLILFTGKLLTGIMIHSTSVIADAFNNLSDAGSSVISLTAAHAAGKPADKEHPYGHGRIEYIAALVVAFIIVEVGITLLKSSIGAIRNPGQMQFSWISFGVLLFSILVKLWLAAFNRYLGKKTGSKVIGATAMDSLLDSVVTGITLLCLLVKLFTGRDIDGYTGVLVSVFVIWEGIQIARDTIAPLIGADSLLSEQYSDEIAKIVREQRKVINYHDLILHDYGPGRTMATLHIELPRTMQLEEAHEIADRIEKQVFRKTGIMLVVHMDPAETEDKRVLKLKERTAAILKILDPALAFHDFQVSFLKNETALSFDLVIPYGYTREKETSVIRQISALMREFDPSVHCSITADRGFTEEVSSGEDARARRSSSPI